MGTAETLYISTPSAGLSIWLKKNISDKKKMTTKIISTGAVKRLVRGSLEFPMRSFRRYFKTYHNYVSDFYGESDWMSLSRTGQNEILFASMAGCCKESFYCLNRVLGVEVPVPGSWSVAPRTRTVLSHEGSSVDKYSFQSYKTAAPRMRTNLRMGKLTSGQSWKKHGRDNINVAVASSDVLMYVLSVYS
ncbi:uncharacterized protein LOC135214153 [Macrobrachium nipponense]|uniref:uncharacterized protein LOC135214153 n=1 Tax=Macrobrachium nipponense TaxID=159736 RepID=UPI0030C7C7BA